MVIANLFPHGISELFNWKGLAFDGTIWEINKTAMMTLISTAICLGLFVIGGRKKALVPTGVQNVAEVSYEFIDKGIASEVIGHDGHKWTPFLGTIFFGCSLSISGPPFHLSSIQHRVASLFRSFSAWCRTLLSS